MYTALKFTRHFGFTGKASAYRAGGPDLDEYGGVLPEDLGNLAAGG